MVAITYRCLHIYTIARKVCEIRTHPKHTKAEQILVGGYNGRAVGNGWGSVEMDFESLKDQWSEVEDRDGIRLSWNTFPSSRMVRV